MIDLDVTTPSPTLDDVWSRLAEVVDPELGIAIVDPGLVCHVTIDNHSIVVSMTMATPACPLSAYLESSVQDALADVAGLRLVTVDIVFDPPWNPDTITDRGRAQLGWRP